jgi:hypothetical protein
VAAAHRAKPLRACLIHSDLVSLIHHQVPKRQRPCAPPPPKPTVLLLWHHAGDTPRLLLRFYDPQSGGVFIDGSNIRHATQASVRAATAVVPQVGAGSRPRIVPAQLLSCRAGGD